MKLNCDLGESFGAWKMHDDDELMSLVDMASIACGYHAGDPLVMQSAIRSALQHQVMIGAHPAYPDLQGFGRRSMRIAAHELTAMLHYQICALAGMAGIQGGSLVYVKPHGALYNDMMADQALLNTVMASVACLPDAPRLVIQATADWQTHQAMAEEQGVALWFEAFADRQYLDNGRLMPRSSAGAVLDIDGMLRQAEQLIQEQTITTAGGNTLSLKVDTLCVHGDTHDALQGVRNIRAMLS